MKNEHDIDIDNIITLSRLYLSEEEKSKIHESLESVLSYFDKLSTVDIEGVEPSAHAFPLYNVLRDDEIDQPWDVKTALLNAPKQRNDQIIVPKVLE